jgi:hypothetical protein
VISSDINRLRLANQQIAPARFRTAAEVVSGLGAMQAQDYSGALWAIGLRLPNATKETIERAIAERKIIRTWPLRGTLHFVAAPDARWMLEILGPRMIARSAPRHRQLGLAEAVFARSRELFLNALQGGRQLTRDAMMSVLEQAGISTAQQRGYLILWRLALERLICFAPHSGKQPAFVLLDEWIPAAQSPDRATALAELARRYFTSHGPASLNDFVGWTGLTIADAKAGLQKAGAQLSQQSIDGTAYWMPCEPAPAADSAQTAHLLPGFDEYILGYKDRGSALDPRHASKIVPGGNGVFQPTIVINGRVVGTWKKTAKKKVVIITASPFIRFKKADGNAVAAAAKRYGQFRDLPVEVEYAP